MSQTLHGNRCGHDPHTPRGFKPPETHRPRPKLLIMLGRAIQDYYDHPEKVLPSLNAANQSERKQRSERREACLLLLGVAIHYTDLVSLKVGVPKNDGSIGGLTIARLAALTQLGMRRTERAMHDLKKAGILRVAKVCHKKSDQEYRGEAAIKSLCPHLFAVFGLDRWLGHERRRAEERKENRNRKHARKACAQIRLVTDSYLARERPSKAPSQTVTERAMNAHMHLRSLRETLGFPSHPTPTVG